MLPTSLYIHMPWCIQKCPYCDFNSHKMPVKIPEEAYVDALIADLQQDLTNYPKNTLCSIFIGGGTPSLISAQAYAKLFNTISQNFHCPNNLEITLEANPGSVEQQRFADYRALGINRLSLGIQSFNPRHLTKLGRVHTADDAHNAILIAKRYFDNINLDIMHSLPEQSVEDGLSDLTAAIQYNPNHISWYQLTIEPNTLFFKRRPTLPTEDIIDQLEIAGMALLDNAHYKRYEISAFCKPGKEALHNLNYWTFGDYFGVGAGSHGKHTKNKEVYRTCKYRQPKDYLDTTKGFIVTTDVVKPQELAFEFMLNATRLEGPISYNLFTERTGLSIDSIKSILQNASAKGLVTLTDTHWQVTSFGRRFTNELQILF